VTSKRAVLLLATTLELAASPFAHADPPAAPEATARHVVDVLIAGDPEEAHAAEASLRELLRRVGLDLRVTIVDRLPADRTPSAPDVAARAWVDLRVDNGALVEVADSSAERTYERRIVAQEGSRAVLLEDVAHVIQAAAESIASGAPPPSAPPPPVHQTAPPVVVVAPPPAPAIVVAPDTTPVGATPAPWSLALVGFFNATPYAHDTAAAFGGGGGVRFATGRFGLWGFGAYHAPFGNDSPPVPLHASVWSARVVPTLELYDTSAFLLEAGAGGGLDVVSLSPGTTSSNVMTLDAKRTEVSPILTALVAAHARLGSGARLFVAGTLDWDLDPRRYVASSSGISSSLLAPLTVRPGISIGLSFDVVQAGARP
jgi:hypothetical protein